MRLRFLVVAALLVASCGDDTTAASSASMDLSVSRDLVAVANPNCPPTVPRDGGTCSSSPPGNLPCTYGAIVCYCGGEGSWSCTPHD
jgi:hypothetical protein